MKLLPLLLLFSVGVVAGEEPRYVYTQEEIESLSTFVFGVHTYAPNYERDYQSTIVKPVYADNGMFGYVPLRGTIAFWEEFGRQLDEEDRDWPWWHSVKPSERTRTLDVEPTKCDVLEIAYCYSEQGHFVSTSLLVLNKYDDGEYYLEKGGSIVSAVGLRSAAWPRKIKDGWVSLFGEKKFVSPVFRIEHYKYDRVEYFESLHWLRFSEFRPDKTRKVPTRVK